MSKCCLCQNADVKMQRQPIRLFILNNIFHCFCNNWLFNLNGMLRILVQPRPDRFDSLLRHCDVGKHVRLGKSRDHTLVLSYLDNRGS